MLVTAMVQNTNTLCLDAKYIIAQIHCQGMQVTPIGHKTTTLCLDAKYIIAQIHNYTIKEIHNYTIAQIHCCWMQVTPIGHKSAVADHGCLIRMRHDPTFPRQINSRQPARGKRGERADGFFFTTKTLFISTNLHLCHRLTKISKRNHQGAQQPTDTLHNFIEPQKGGNSNTEW